MPQPVNLLKAELQAITWSEDQAVEDLGDAFSVQFNPETLKINFANQSSGGDQSGGSATQHVAKGSTKLSFDLWYDVSAPQPNGAEETDVRRLTAKINELMQPRDDLDGAPPGVRFLWGTFLFEGVVDSMNETLELFSESGQPLRASVAISMSKQDVQIQFNEQPGAGTPALPGTTPTELVRQGDTIQGIAARSGRAADWQKIALKNGIESPRRPRVGQQIVL